MRERKSLERFRQMQNELDQNGFLVDIRTISQNEFSFAVNGEIKKIYKKRESANKALIKLYQNTINQKITNANY